MKAFPSRELIFVRARRSSTSRNAFFCVYLTLSHTRNIRTILFHAQHVSVGGKWRPGRPIPVTVGALVHPRANRPYLSTLVVKGRKGRDGNFLERLFQLGSENWNDRYDRHDARDRSPFNLRRVQGVTNPPCREPNRGLHRKCGAVQKVSHASARSTREDQWGPPRVRRLRSDPAERHAAAGPHGLARVLRKYYRATQPKPPKPTQFAPQCVGVGRCTC